MRDLPAIRCAREPGAGRALNEVVEFQGSALIALLSRACHRSHAVAVSAIRTCCASHPGSGTESNLPERGKPKWFKLLGLRAPRSPSGLGHAQSRFREVHR